MVWETYERIEVHHHVVYHIRSKFHGTLFREVVGLRINLSSQIFSMSISNINNQAAIREIKNTKYPCK